MTFKICSGFDLKKDVLDVVGLIPAIDLSKGSYVDLKILRLKWRNDLNPNEAEVSNSFAHFIELFCVIGLVPANQWKK